MTLAALHAMLGDGVVYPNLEVVLVDNGSSAEVLAVLRERAAADPRITLIENGENLGFARGNNAGIAAATGEYVLLLNNDTFLAPGAALAMVRHLQRNPDIGIVGPMTNNIGNEARIEIAYADMDDMARAARDLATGHRGQWTPIAVCAYFCAMFRRADLDRLGHLPEIYGRGMFEDDDHCATFRKARPSDGAGRGCVLPSPPVGQLRRPAAGRETGAVRPQQGAVREPLGHVDAACVPQGAPGQHPGHPLTHGPATPRSTKDRPMRTVLVHYHIYKNAGTSFDHVLAHNFAGRHELFDGPYPFFTIDQEQLDRIIMRRADAVAFSSHQIMLPPPSSLDYRVIAAIFLRNPYLRIASIYRFKRGPERADGTPLANLTADELAAALAQPDRSAPDGAAPLPSFDTTATALAARQHDFAGWVEHCLNSPVEMMQLSNAQTRFFATPYRQRQLFPARPGGDQL